MAKTARVFLLSNKQSHYDAFIENGYSDILWFKSTPEVLSYLAKHPDVFENIDIVMVRDIFYDGKNGRKIYDKVYRKAFLNSLFYVEESFSEYTLLTNKTARTNLKKRDIFKILGSCNFEREPEEEISLISKENKNIKILFVGEQAFYPLVCDFFESQGINSVNCVSNVSINSSEEIEELSNYDVIISSNSNHLIECVDELTVYLYDKNHMLFLANFDFSRVVDTNIAHLSLANTFSGDIDKRLIHTFKDIETLYSYAFHIIMQEYSKLNDKVKLSNLRSFNEILDEYISYRNSYIRETDALREKLVVIDEVERLSRRFMRKYMRYSNIRDFDGLRFEKLDGAIAVSFVHEREMLVRITYYTDGINLKSPFYKEFNLEVQNSKGNLMDLGMRSIYDDRRKVNESCPPVIKDEDYSKIEGIYKKLLKLYEKKNEKSLKLK